jgi:hypothetical protein
MDYLFFTTLATTALLWFVVSYDIACQWSVKLWDRMAKYPPKMQLNRESMDFTFLIPKFHLPAHIPKCHTAYSFNYTPGVARTDGEAPERGWAHINPTAMSTREMGPGHRQDTLDDHFGDWNWKKVIAMGTASCLIDKFVV